MPAINLDPSVRLSYHAESRNDALVLHCRGQLTARTRLALRSGVLDLLYRHHRIIVDLGRIDYLDRSGLEMIVSLYSSARTAGATLKFVNLATEVSEIDS